MSQNFLKTENQWKEINRNLQFYKLLALLGACGTIISLIMSAFGAFSNPVVVLKDGTQNCFVNAKRASVEVTDDDISEFIKKWVANRYEWEDLDEEELIRNLSPFTSEGLLAKIREQFKKGPEKEFKDKAVTQYVSKNIQFSFTNDKVTATFDRVLRLSGVPLIDPAQISFSLVRGTKTRLNPQGIYVNGITEHSSP